MTFIYYKTEHHLQELIRDVAGIGKSRRRRKVFFTFTLAAVALMIILALSFTGVGRISPVEASNTLLSGNDFSQVSPAVVQEAVASAEKLFGDGQASSIYANQLLTAYTEAKDRDFIILFNSGGWGTNSLQKSPDWTTIAAGIKDELTGAGYAVVTLNYQRTVDNLRGRLNELIEIATGYDSKAGYLAEMANFLTDHNPNLKVILAGQSTGTMICDYAMQLLEDNDRVYSVQTGSPFWHTENISLRTVLINDNGVVPDAFSRGDFFTIVKDSLVSLIELNKPKLEQSILGLFSAPGHDYWWKDPGVYSQIEEFLNQYFGIKVELNPIN